MGAQSQDAAALAIRGSRAEIPQAFEARDLSTGRDHRL